MKGQTRKQRDQLAREKQAQIEVLKARLNEIDGFDVITEEIDDEYYAKHSQVKALEREVFELGQPIRNICRHTQALVSANID